MSTPARTARRMTCTRSAPTASRAARASTPTSATGISPTSFRPTMRRGCARAGADSAGFTLIEIMVVVVIIGVVAALMVLSFTLTGRDRELEKESDRLFALFTYAREQAELQTRLLAGVGEEGEQPVAFHLELAIAPGEGE